MAFLTHRDLLHPPLKRVQTLGQGRVGVDNILEKNESVPKFILEVGKDRMGECFFQTVPIKLVSPQAAQLSIYCLGNSISSVAPP